MTDRELIELFSARSEDAVPALSAQYGPYCRTVAGRLLSDGRDVDECLNDCWLAVWNAIPPAKPERFRGWLAAVVRNRAIAIGQENGRRPPTVDEAALELAPCLTHGEGPDSRVEAAELSRAISSFLRTQKPEIRAAFLRRYWYADTVEQVARQMGWTVSKTKTVLFRTRNRLWEYLNKEGYL